MSVDHNQLITIHKLLGRLNQLEYECLECMLVSLPLALPDLFQIDLDLIKNLFKKICCASDSVHSGPFVEYLSLTMQSAVFKTKHIFEQVKSKPDPIMIPSNAIKSPCGASSDIDLFEVEDVLTPLNDSFSHNHRAIDCNHKRSKSLPPSPLAPEFDDTRSLDDVTVPRSRCSGSGRASSEAGSSYESNVAHRERAVVAAPKRNMTRHYTKRTMHISSRNSCFN